MKKFFIVFVIGLLPITLPAVIIVDGVIRTAEGRRPVLAHAHLTRIMGSPGQAIQSVQADREGGFRIDIAEPGLYKIWITAADHLNRSIPLILDQADDNIQLKITLSPHLWKEEIEEPKIIGSWNRFNFSAADAMQRQSDGTFTYLVEADTDTVAYQLLGLDRWSRSINGTQSDYFVYDGGGDYRSVLRVEPGPVKIVFDPRKLLRTRRTNLPYLRVDRDHHPIKTAFEIVKLVNHNTIMLNTALGKYRQTHGDLEGFEFDGSEVEDRLREIIDARTDMKTSQLASVYYVGLPEAKLTAEEIERILELTPPSSPLWEVVANRINNLYTLGPEKIDPLLERFWKESPVKEVQAQALAGLTFMAYSERDLEKKARLYRQLKEDYGDLPSIGYTLHYLDPDKAIQAGKRVPDFEAVLMGSGARISSKSLRGKYVLIDFWAVWCGPCVAEMPTLHSAYEQFKGPAFELVSFSFDSQPGDVEKFRADKWAMPWRHVFVEGGFNSELARSFEVMGIPKPVLVAPDGTILATESKLRGENLEKTLAQYLPLAGS